MDIKKCMKDFSVEGSHNKLAGSFLEDFRSGNSLKFRINLKICIKIGKYGKSFEKTLGELRKIKNYI